MRTKLPVLAALCALFVLVFASREAIASASAGLRLCWELILPSLFPFFVLSSLLAQLGLPQLLGRALAPPARRFLGCSGQGATALLLGLTGGYPMGAAYLAQLEEQGQISVAELERLLLFCNCSGPAFLIGAVGAGVFGSVRAGLLLYACHALASLLIGILTRPGEGRRLPAAAIVEVPGPGSPAAPEPPPLGQAIPEAVQRAVSASLNVCGFVVVFSIFTGLLDEWGLLDGFAARLAALTGMDLPSGRALLRGFFELGGGIGALRGLAPTPGHLALAAGLIGWGGISVQFQTLSVLSESGCKSSPQLAGRLMSAAIGAALAYGAGRIFL